MTARRVSSSAFQDQGTVRYCHGCGPDNESGLRIKSYWAGDDAVATWRAEPHHCGGTRENLNGGIIAALIDCHSLNLAIAHAYRREGRAIGSAPRIGYVTADLHVSYLKPVPIRLIDDTWIDKYRAGPAAYLADLKRELEKES